MVGDLLDVLVYRGPMGGAQDRTITTTCTIGGFGLQGFGKIMSFAIYVTSYFPQVGHNHSGHTRHYNGGLGVKVDLTGLTRRFFVTFRVGLFGVNVVTLGLGTRTNYRVLLVTSRGVGVFYGLFVGFLYLYLATSVVPGEQTVIWVVKGGHTMLLYNLGYFGGGLDKVFEGDHVGTTHIRPAGSRDTRGVVPVGVTKLRLTSYNISPIQNTRDTSGTGTTLHGICSISYYSTSAIVFGPFSRQNIGTTLWGWVLGRVASFVFHGNNCGTHFRAGTTTRTSYGVVFTTTFPDSRYTNDFGSTLSQVGTGRGFTGQGFVGRAFFFESRFGVRGGSTSIGRGWGVWLHCRGVYHGLFPWKFQNHLRAGHPPPVYQWNNGRFF